MRRMWGRTDWRAVALAIVGLMCSYKSLILDWLVHSFSIGAWTALMYKALSSMCLGVITLQMYIGMTSITDKY